jgi:hypothetical protein
MTARALSARLRALADELPAALPPLDPDERRALHAALCVVQERVTDLLAEASDGMAKDGADRVDARGVPTQLRGNTK